MKPEPEDFQQLRRLLVLKRYEQPPPGYFDRFSVQVVARIRAGEVGGEDSLFGRVQWLQQLWTALETKPIVAGAFGAAVCGLLLAGIVYTDTNSSPFAVGVAQNPQIPSQSAADIFSATVNANDGLLLPAAATPTSLFQQFKDNSQRPIFQQATLNAHSN